MTERRRLGANKTVDRDVAAKPEPKSADPDPVEPADGGKRSQAAKLVDLAADAELFHTPVGDPYAAVVVAEHRETHQLRSTAIRGWLRRRYWDAYGQPVSGSAIADAIETLAARAEFGSEAHEVYVRVAGHNGRVYVDLANDAWQAVEIGPDGWHVVESPPVRFRRPATMEPLPQPVRGGSLALLRPFVNIADDDGWRLFAGYLVAALRPSGPYLVLILYGEHGSAKSTTSKIARLLLDPGRAPLRAEPREQQDLLIAARNNRIVAFDNVSHLQPWLSDALCRLSTGGGLGKRQLYTDQDEIVLDAQRPQILNGITEFATRGDLLDRAIILEQLAIANAARRSEEEFWQAFELVRPLILGAIFDGVAAALRNHASVELDELPRMADPTRWVTAAEPALGWPAGTFAATYQRNRREGSALALDAALIAGPIRELVACGDWLGTAAELLDHLSQLAGDDITAQREWPKTPRALVAALKRLAPDLRAAGIAWQRLERTGIARLHSIQLTRGPTVTNVTTDTTITNLGDGPTLNLPTEGYAAIPTVTLDPSRSDGRDGRDGRAPATDGDPSWDVSDIRPAHTDGVAEIADMPIEEDYPKSAWDADADKSDSQLDAWDMEPAVKSGGGGTP